VLVASASPVKSKAKFAAMAGGAKNRARSTSLMIVIPIIAQIALSVWDGKRGDRNGVGDRKKYIQTTAQLPVPAAVSAIVMK
jgi:hypothetical protein